MILTQLCKILGVENPVINAPMSGSATSQLAAAVANAGGFGMLGMGGVIPDPDCLRSEIRKTRQLTDNPFGVGFISSAPGVEKLVDVALEEGVTAIGHSFADPSQYIEAAKQAGVKTIVQIQTLNQARHARDLGVDIIVAQGTEAGGHTGYIGTLSLVPAVVDECPGVPIVASGGIGDGRGLAAALVLGACGVWLGTRFVASEECSGSDWIKDAVVNSGTDDTVLTKVYDLVNNSPFPKTIGDRVLRNEFTDKWNKRDDDVVGNREDIAKELHVAMESGDLSIAPVRAGSASGLIAAIEPAAMIINRIIDDAERILKTVALSEIP